MGPGLLLSAAVGARVGQCWDLGGARDSAKVSNPGQKGKPTPSTTAESRPGDESMATCAGRGGNRSLAAG